MNFIKYISNNLSDFEFHDAELSLMGLSDNTLTVSAQMLNIHKGTAQNSHPTDMEIERAVITFHNFSLHSFDCGDTWMRDANGEWFLSEKGKVFIGTPALEKFLCELQKWICIFRFGASDNDAYLFEAGSADEPWFEAKVTFNFVTIEWDEYRKIAWYEEHQQKN